MYRREFLRLTAMAASAAKLSAQNILAQKEEEQQWRSFEVNTKVTVLRPVGRTQVWLPLPLTRASAFQRLLASSVRFDGGKEMPYDSQRAGLEMLAINFPAGIPAVVTTTQQVSTRNWFVDLEEPRFNTKRRAASDVSDFLRPTRYVPTDGIVKAKSDEITKGATNDLQKAKVIYDWIVENTYRNPKTPGCGVGDIRPMLETGDLGGKCADINALFVGLIKAAGVPARDVYGIRLGQSKMGTTSLGTPTGDISKAQHCRAEVYLTDFGWVPMDPADVRKVVLEEPPGNLGLSDPKVKVTRQRLFGSWEMNWMAFNYAQDVVLPGSSGKPLHFFMYPQAETADGRLDCLDPDNFHYQISSRPLTD